MKAIVRRLPYNFTGGICLFNSSAEDWGVKLTSRSRNYPSPDDSLKGFDGRAVVFVYPHSPPEKKGPFLPPLLPQPFLSRCRHHQSNHDRNSSVGLYSSSHRYSEHHHHHHILLLALTTTLNTYSPHPPPHATHQPPSQYTPTKLIRPTPLSSRSLSPSQGPRANKGS